jgi:NADPH2:quinone reductase
MVYRRTGRPSVIAAEELDVPQPGPGEVLVRMAVSGVNPTDWKSRAGDGSGTPPPAGWQVPNHDGAGLIVGVGNGVDTGLMHERVWVWEAAYQRPWGTAAQYTVVPAQQAVPLGPSAPYELGAALGVPFLTAHRCLTVGETMPDRIAPGSLTGRTVLVQGGAGAVGNAAIQLAAWADATVIATVSSPEKAKLAAAAGAAHVINYKQQDVATEVRRNVPGGVDAVVEVSVTNAAADAAVLAMHGCVALYAGTAGDEVTVPLRPMMAINARWQFVLLYTVPPAAKAVAIEDVAAAVVDEAIAVGDEVGLPTHRFPLERTADAHAAVEAGAVGKVLVTIDDDPAPSIN